MCWLPSIGLNIDKNIREGGVFGSDGVYDFVILFFAEVVEEGNESIFDSIDGHEGGDDGHFVDGVDSGRKVVSLQLFFKKFKWIDVLHTI